jgi:hypothetical protein
MTCDKFGAHYMLSPGGKLLKWPVITIGKDGMILKTEWHEDHFKEQHGVQFCSGILLPAFVDIWWEYPATSTPKTQGNIHFHFRNGTILIGFPGALENPISKSMQTPMIVPCRLKYHRPQIFPDLGNDNRLSQFEKIKKILLHYKNISLNEILSAATNEAAQAVKHPELGRLEPGCAPGLLLLQNADLINLTITAQSTIKWLNFG